MVLGIQNSIYGAYQHLKVHKRFWLKDTAPAAAAMASHIENDNARLVLKAIVVVPLLPFFLMK
jgi:hypothetical protein